MTSPIHFPAPVIGLMSGTSADGVDAALLYTDGKTLAEAGASLFVPYDDTLRADILALMRGQGDEAAIAQALTDVHIDAVRQLMQKSNITPHLVGFHGQTIRHAPHEGITLQIGDPARMARALGVPVIADFRSNDVRHGGQGAPLVPLYHAALAERLAKPVMVVNIGGVSNVTWIGTAPSPLAGEGRGEGAVQMATDRHTSPPPHPGSSPGQALTSPARGEEVVLAFDSGPGNALIDDWVHAHTGARYDKGGALAAKGTVDASALAAFAADPFFALPAPKSLDRLHFSDFFSSFQRKLESIAEADARRERDSRLRGNDKVEGLVANGAATLTAMTALAIAKACDIVPVKPERLLITGGGRHNPTLMQMLSAYCGCRVEAVEQLGWDGDMLEAQAFAYLAARSVQGLPLSLPGTTGVKQPCTGGVFYDVK